MRPRMNAWARPSVPTLALVVGILLELFSSQVGLCSGSPIADATIKLDRKSQGVKINGRLQVQDGEKMCPQLQYCKCKAFPAVIDVTCEGLTSSMLHSECAILKKTERTIRYFNIRHSNIPRLEDHIFMGIKIIHLYIHSCKMKSLGPNSLSSQGNTLKILVLSKNDLTEVPTTAVKRLKNLDHLNLNNNRIVALRSGAFIGLSKVTRLTLYHNKIHRIDAKAFDGLTKDTIRLNLGKNNLQEIPHKALQNLRYLKTLEMPENHISDIEPGSFEGLINLDRLTLNSNGLSHLKEGMFQGMPKLKALYIDNNQIRTIHKLALKGLEASLEYLSLTGNKIQEFPTLALRPIHKLTSLHVDENKIKKIGENAFQGFGEHIKHLWLQDNIIQEIPAPAFQDLHSLEWVKLYNNELRTLHYELMEPVLDTLSHIDIHSNPLECDCELRWYRQWIDEEWNPVEKEWLKDTFCRDPADNKEHNIREVELKDMFCSGEVRDKPGKNRGGAAQMFKLHDWMTLMAMLAFSQLWVARRRA